ncbi:3-phenylpropionate dioxygenase, partial [Dietzia cercidiphylli]|nr:3-phenylpropionate dioxygenase [Dietzia cercidiphylli]
NAERNCVSHCPGGLQLARRTITVDESVLRTQNLAIFL